MQARGKEALRGPAYHQRLLPAHTQLKYRQAGQGGDADEPTRDLAAELLAAEATHFTKKNGAPALIDDADEDDEASVSGGAKRALPSGDGEGEDLEAKRRRILAETRDIDADDDSEEDEEDSDDDDDSDDDSDAELQRELDRVRREREERKKKEVCLRDRSTLHRLGLTHIAGGRATQRRRGCPRTKHCAWKSSPQQARFQHEAPLGR